MTKSWHILIIVILLGLCSCRAEKSIITIEIKEIDTCLTSTFKNSTYYAKRPLEESSILGVFNVKDSAKGDEVTLRFIDEKNLEIIYFDSISTKYYSVTFKGKFKKKGYFQIVLDRKFFWVPLFFRWSRINRIRIALTTDGDLILFHKKKEISYSFWLHGLPTKNERAWFEKGRNSFYLFEKVELNHPEYSSRH